MEARDGAMSDARPPECDTEIATTTALPSPELSPSVAEPGTPVGAKAEWVACDGLLHATIGTVAPEGYWPGMVTFEFDSDTGLVTADDARGIAAHLIAAADRADLATKEARP